MKEKSRQKTDGQNNEVELHQRKYPVTDERMKRCSASLLSGSCKPKPWCHIHTHTRLKATDNSCVARMCNDHRSNILSVVNSLISLENSLIASPKMEVYIGHVQNCVSSSIILNSPAWKQSKKHLHYTSWRIYTMILHSKREVTIYHYTPQDGWIPQT